MPTLQDLREDRASIWNKMEEIITRTGGAPAGDDLITYNALETDLDAKGATLEAAEGHDKRRKQMNAVNRAGVVPGQRGTFGEPVDDEGGDDAQAAYNRAFIEMIRNGTMEMSGEDRQILRDGLAQDEKTGKAIRAALGVGTTTAGGYTIPPEFRDKIVETQKWYGPMLNEAEVIQTSTGATLPWPTNDDTGNMGAILAENTALTQQDIVFGQANLGAYMYTSKLVLVSYQLLQDRPDIDTFLAKKLGQRLGRVLNNHFTTGTGTSQPTGIVTGSSVAITGSGSLATTGGVAYANLVDLVESLDPAYGASTNLKFMGHQTVRKAMRKLVDGQQRPLWEVNLQAGAPDSLLGYPFLLNNDMPTIAQNSKSLGFGDIEQAYVIRIVKDVTAVRLNERYADALQVGFFAFERADGQMQDTNAFKIFQTTPTA